MVARGMVGGFARWGLWRAVLPGVEIAMLGGCAGGDMGGAEGVDLVRMDTADAVFEQPFSVVSTVRELPGGRVLVADPLSQVLIAVDLDAALADTIGRVGEGPAEYRQPDAVWPLPDGKTLLVDLGNGRLTDLSADLEFGDTRPYAVGDPMAGTMVVAIPQGMDALGRIYFRGFGGVGPPSDSASILRADLATNLMDTAGTFKTASTTREVTGGPNNQNERISPIPLSPEDAWGVAADGRVVVVRAADYHVDWIDEDGSVTSGPPVPYAPVSIGRAEKEEWLDSRAETGGGLGISAQMVNGSVSIVAARGGDPDSGDDLDSYPWPEVKTAFYGRPVPVDPLGRAWVRRHREAGEAPRYDLFDGAGQVVMTIEFAMDRRVVGFGDGRLYAVRMDEVGLQYLERYTLP